MFNILFKIAERFPLRTDMHGTVCSPEIGDRVTLERNGATLKLLCVDICRGVVVCEHDNSVIYLPKMHLAGGNHDNVIPMGVDFPIVLRMVATGMVSTSELQADIKMNLKSGPSLADPELIARACLAGITFTPFYEAGRVCAFKITPLSSSEAPVVEAKDGFPVLTEETRTLLRKELPV